MEVETESDGVKIARRRTPLALWIALIVVMILGVLWDRVPLENASARLERVPLRGLGFAGQELPLNEVELKVFGKADVLNRVYLAGGQKFVLTIIDGTGDRHAVHDPLYCFKGAGWSVEGQEARRVAGGRARLLRLSQKGKSAEAMIWFSDGRERHASALRYWWQTTLRRVTMGRSEEEPILVIVQPAVGRTLNWERVFESFPALRVI